MSNEQKHTPEPWIGTGMTTIRAAAHNTEVGSTTGYSTGDAAATANRDRIVACVNACAGMDDPAADIARLRLCDEEAKNLRTLMLSRTNQRDELLAALKHLLKDVDATTAIRGWSGTGGRTQARAAIANVGG